MDAPEINLLDPLVFENKVPDEWFTWLRHNAPVYRHHEPGGPGFWVLTRYEDVVEVGRDGVTYSSEQSRGGVVALEDADAAADLSAQGRMMLSMDAPDHTRYRSLVNRGSAPRMINALSAHIRQMVVEIIEPALEKRDCDFVTDVAAELPLQVIAEMLGVPYEDRHKLFEWSNRMIGSKDPQYAVSQEKVQAAAIEMYMYSNELAKKRREDPRDDIVTALLKADMDGDQLFGVGLQRIFSVARGRRQRNDAQRHVAWDERAARLSRSICDAHHRSLAGPVGYQEILRWASPVMYFRRNVTKDTEVRGQKIKAGDKVSIWYISANRDEEIFPDPFTFDIHHTPNQHVAFGGGGPHLCSAPASREWK